MHRTHAAFQAHRGSSSTIGDADLLPRQPIFRTRDLAHAREYLGGVFVEARFAYLSRPFGVKHFQTIHRRMSMLLAGSCFSSESAPRPFHHGFEDEAEQSIGRPCCQTNGGSKRPSELTSSIVPGGTSCQLRFSF